MVAILISVAAENERNEFSIWRPLLSHGNIGGRNVKPALLCFSFSFFSYFIFKNYFIFDATIILQLSHIFPLHPHPPSAPPTSTIRPFTVVRVRGSFIDVLRLIPSSSFHQSPPPSSPPTTVSLFHDSVPLLLFCSLVYSVHQIPLISEITWYVFHRLAYFTWHKNLHLKL